MKRQSKNNKHSTRFHAIPKHTGTFPFHPGNTITLDGSDRIPAYNTQGKEYNRHLPPMRDQKQIDVRLLCYLINQRTNGNRAEVIQGGIRLNQVDIKLANGLAICDQVSFRFIDLRELLLELRKERILKVDPDDIRTIKNEYFR